MPWTQNKDPENVENKTKKGKEAKKEDQLYVEREARDYQRLINLWPFKWCHM